MWWVHEIIATCLGVGVLNITVRTLTHCSHWARTHFSTDYFTGSSLKEKKERERVVQTFKNLYASSHARKSNK